MPSLVDLPIELRCQIWSQLVDLEFLDQGYGRYKNPGSKEDGLLQCHNNRKDTSDISALSVLYINRLIYREAIEVYYKMNTFCFTTPVDLLNFSFDTYGKDCLSFVRKICLEIDLFFDYAGHENSIGRIVPLSWKQISEKDAKGLHWLFPSPEYLEIDFAQFSTRPRGMVGRTFVYADDGGVELVELRKMLKQSVTVKCVKIEGLRDGEMEEAMKLEMME